MMRYKPLLIVIVACVCVTGIVVPTILQNWTTRYPLGSAPDTLSVRGRGRPYTGEATLSDREQELRDHVTELERIQTSVRNEMREIEQERYRVLQEMERQKSESYNLETSIHLNKKTLLSLQGEILKNSHQLYATTQKPSITIYQPPPIIILPPEPVATTMTTTRPRPLVTDSAQCADNPKKCLDFLRCPLTKNFKVFLYSSTEAPKLSISRDDRVFTLFEDYLKTLGTLSATPEDACIFILLLAPPTAYNGRFLSSLAGDISFLPHWNQRGVNHVLVNTLHSDTPTNLGTGTARFNHSLAILVDSATSDNWRHGYDILVPRAKLKNLENGEFRAPCPLVPAYRKYFIHFVGQLASKAESAGVTVAMMLSLTKALMTTNEEIVMKTNCGAQSVSMGTGTWLLCGSENDRLLPLSLSTYTIIPATTADIAMMTRLREALEQGAVPVIVGGAPLPLDTVIDWSLASLSLPCERFHEILLFLRSQTHDQILEMRRQGQFLYQTYFSSPLQVLKSVVAVLRHILLHPPPPTPGYQPHRWYSYEGSAQSPPLKSPSYLSNYTTYGHRFWNSAPGPFHMYPFTPWSATPISGSRYASMSQQELKGLPPHIVLGGGITGPFFENYILGDTPIEYFTVVILTYKREEVVFDAVLRLDGLAFLAKVIIVWNDVDSNPYDVKWPSISAPVEVIWSDQNSLNSRFLPYTGILTEAVLSLDDDVYLRHDEIQFAFRVWRESRDRIVGFPGRFHSYNIHNNGWLYNSNYTCELSMVLTGAAFVHKYYLYLYTYWQPSQVKQVVDQYMNCEDIAMNFLVSHITRKPPLKVTSRWTFRCTDCPEALSQSYKHFNERHDCINHLVRIYGYMPLLFTQFRLDSVLFKTKLPSHLQKCYQYV